MQAIPPHIEMDKEAAKQWLRANGVSIRQAAEYAGMPKVYLAKILYSRTHPRPLKLALWWRIVAHAVLAETQLDIVDHTALEVPPADGRTWEQIASEVEAKRAAQKAA